MSIKEKLANNQVIVGTWITLAHPSIAEIFAGAGFDWVAIDLEHSVLTIRDAEDLIRTAQLASCSPLVRLTSNSTTQIKRVMDAGAQGVIVPMVNSAEDAERAFKAMRYPPVGHRGVGLARAQGYGEKFDAYREWLHTSSVLVVQIENIAAVKRLDDIFSVEGIDAFMVGPYDLSASMGIPGEFEHPEFKAVLDEVLKIATNRGIPAGIHQIEPDVSSLESLVQDNYKFIAYSLDIRMLASCSYSAVDKIRELTQSS